MGLSKKLGASSQKMGRPVSNNVPYMWSNQTYTVEEVLKKFKLPCVVQCATDSCTVVWSDFQFDLRQPLLFYSKRSAQKVHAVSLRQTNDVPEEIGPPLAIPEDYEGWFGAAPKCKSLAKRHFRVSDIANSSGRQFLVTTQCPAFTSSRAPNRDLQYVPHDITPGEVLKRVCILDPDPSHSDCPDLVKEHGPCLEFLDEKGDDVVIPLSHSVLTYEIGDVYPQEETRIFKIISPINAGNSNLPRILTLVHGDLPLLAYAFTGIVRCYSVFTEDTILAATLDNPESRCLEVATDSCVKFRICLNESTVKKTSEYINAFQICEHFGAKFLTGIKVSFTLKPQVSNLGEEDLSFGESASDAQEVEANSEFDIAWGSVKKAPILVSPGSSGKNSSEDAQAASKDPLLTETKPHEMKPVLSELNGDSASTDSSVTQHRDFTEQEIVDLLAKKGLIDPADKTNEPRSGQDPLAESRVTDNPLFYFFQRNPEQTPWKSEESAPDYPSQGIHPIDNLPDPGSPPLGGPKAEPTLVSPKDKEEASNPLAYLFEPTPDQSNDKAESTNPPQTTMTSPTQDQRNSLSALVSDIDVSQFKTIVYKTARAYTGSDDEDEDEDDDDSTESDENCSDDSDLPDDISEQSFVKENDGPSVIVKHAMSRPIDASANPGPETGSQKANSTIHRDVQYFSSTNHKTFAAPSDVTANMKQAGRCDVSVDDVDVFVDLMTLAEVESNKHFANEVLKNAESSCNKAGSEVKLRNNDIDSAGRLNNLLEEISQLVNVSSDIILDANKIHVNQQHERTSGTAMNNQNLPLPPPRLLKTKINAGFPDTSSNGLLSRDVSSSSHAEVDFNEFALKTSVLKRGDIKPRLNHVGDLNPRLRPVKNEECVSALTRSRVELNLDQVGQELTLPKPQRPPAAESSVSSILNVVNKHRTRFSPPQTNDYSPSHPARRSNERTNKSSDYITPVAMGDEQGCLFPYKGQRVLSLTSGKNVLTSFQNLDRSGSTHSSSSSIYSSSLDNSFLQGIPKLVVIGDPDLVLEDNHNLTQLSSRDFASRSATHLSKCVPNSKTSYAAENENHSENIRIEEYYSLLKNGNQIPRRLTVSEEQHSQLLVGNDYLREDYV